MKLLPFDFPQKNGYAVTPTAVHGGFHLQLPKGELTYYPQFFSKKISDRSVAYFVENERGISPTASLWRNLTEEEFRELRFKNIPWRHDKIRMFGKWVYQPRYTAWHADDGMSYTYSGLTMPAVPWNKGLLFLKQEVEKATGFAFNSVLLNWYRDGEDHMGWHADDEKELGINPAIASVNFGAQRFFHLRRKENPKEKLKIPLGHGSLLLMHGELQHHWQHGIMKERRVKQMRFNLTFRKVLH